MKNSDRTERIAKDMFDYGGATYSIMKLKKFLGVSYEVASNIVAPLPAVYGSNTQKKYYYYDIAEALSRGVS